MEHSRQRETLTHIIRERDRGLRARCLLARSLLVLCSSAAWGCGEDAIARVPDAAITAHDAAASAGKTAQMNALADGVVGSACTSASDCGPGSCMQTVPIVNVDYPGGYCTARCASDDECGSQGVCVPDVVGFSGSCYRRCDDDHPCGRDGYRCRVVSNIGRCIAGPEPLPDHVAGGACASDADCGGGGNSCARMVGGDPAPGGYCSQACAIDDDCGAGGVCINGIRVVTISSGRCLQSCRQTSDCRAGYACSPFGGPNLQGGDGACTPLKDQTDAGTL